jgi:hypothetical protein
MGDTFNLAELTQKITNAHAQDLDNALAQYVKSAISLLEAQGKNITEYTFVKVDNPMQFTADNSLRITGQWKVVKMSELENLPRYE